MRAMLSVEPGGPDSLQLTELDTPQPKKGEVLIAVKAAGVNFPDTLMIRDLYQFKPPRPFAPGGELAGVVEAVGEGVGRVRPGDRVIALPGSGAFATHAVVPEAVVIPIPDSMPFDEAACFVFTYGTSHYALKDRARLEAGETLLVLGAAGGVGAAAVELGKAMGARVVAAVSSEEKAAFARELGADATVIYPAALEGREAIRALSAEFKAACAPAGANVIYDAVGGNYTEAAIRAIAWEGRLLVVGFPAGIPKLPLNLTLLKSCQVVGV
ncbi:MAG: NADPH:quinone oxidoreductase family protein, partial [Alphaproteobacteria bacterium]